MAAFSTVVMGVLLIATTSPQVAAVQALSLGQNGTRVVKKHAACDASSLSANVVLPGDAGYDTARSQWASHSSSSTVADARTKPQMIIFCSSDSEVQEAVSFAENCGYKISVRSGGHNYAGYSSCPESSTDCIQVDLSNLETFALDTTTTPKRATIGAGLSLKQVYSALAPHGVTIMAGICSSVNVGGHFQTSAGGWFQRTFGMGLDSVRSFRIVLADAQVHTIDASSDPDLYWAVLGGGAGSWGIILDYTVDTWASSDYPRLKVASFVYPFSRNMLVAVGNAITAANQDTTLARDLLTGVFVDSTAVRPEYSFLPFKDFINLRIIWMGVDNGDLTSASPFYTTAYESFANLPGAIPLVPLSPIALHALPLALVGDWDVHHYRNNIHGFGLNEWPSNAFWETLADELAARIAIPELEMSFQIFPWGGPGTQIYNNKGKNAYMLRDAKVFIDDWVFFLTDSGAQIAEDHIKAFREATGHHWEEDGVPHTWMTPDTLINKTHSGPADFVHSRLQTRLARSNSDWERLLDVKTRVDPADLFHSGVTIPVRAAASSSGSAVGDPHLQNVHGERFDLMQAGWHTLIEIPRKAPAQRVLLLVEAEARHDGSACADMYFQSLNITGEWAQEKQTGGLRFSARDSDATGSTWMTFGNVDLKVARGRTLQGAHYLNFYVRRLARAGFAIGGLLGEDDHTKAATPADSCQGRLSLAQLPSGRAASTAEASLV